MKRTLRERQIAAASKHRNWSKIVEYQRAYMRDWRNREPGKTIIRYANKAYNEKNKLAIAMYRQLSYLAKSDGMFGSGKKRRRLGLGDWNIA